MDCAAMQAWVIYRYGGPEVFERVELDIPEPAAGEVRIRVKATSVNPVDYKIRRGDAAALWGELPAILHPDAAGVVSAIGSGVQEFREGDRVFCFANGLAGKPGALADEICVDVRLLAKMPENLDFTEAVAMPLVATTAWFSLYDQAEVEKGMTVLIQGDTGGVGHIAVQLAKLAGANVFATCGSDEKCRLAEDLGADKAFNYRKTAAETLVAEATGGVGFDVIYNTPGTPMIDHSVACARHGATILDILGEFPTQPGFQAKWLSFRSVFAGRAIMGGGEDRHGEILRKIAGLLEDGALRPLIDSQRFTFEEISAAHAYAETGRPTGKVVVSRL